MVHGRMTNYFLADTLVGGGRNGDDDGNVVDMHYIVQASPASPFPALLIQFCRISKVESHPGFQ